jgi:cholesterol transport system auxiliary component
VLQGRVVLLDRSRQQLAELVLNLEKPSPSPDARGGVTALTGAVDQLAADLADWEGTLLKAGNPGDCFG